MAGRQMLRHARAPCRHSRAQAASLRQWMINHVLITARPTYIGRPATHYTINRVKSADGTVLECKLADHVAIFKTLIRRISSRRTDGRTEGHTPSSSGHRMFHATRRYGMSSNTPLL
ncbi:hypothetical protein J6590_022571 [Homalodisca vitripennis]|nr:hypothetical protein J6590_022571 [Homalodisca vitripennis]